MANFFAGLVCFVLLVLFVDLFISHLPAPNREGSVDDYGTYYDGCTEPMISC